MAKKKNGEDKPEKYGELATVPTEYCTPLSEYNFPEVPRSQVTEKTILDSKILTFIEDMAALALTQFEMAKLLRVSEATLSNWKKQHKEVLEAVERGSIRANQSVARATFLAATGQMIKKKVAHVDRNTGKTAYIVTEMLYNDGANERWLTNRMPQEWKGKKISVETNEVSRVVEEMTMAEKMAIARANGLVISDELLSEIEEDKQ